jgi:hypothetical protein
MTSDEMSEDPISACSASVRTADSTSSFARSDFGLNSLARRLAKASNSTAPVDLRR